MGTDAPTIVTIPVRCAPKKAPCPKCGKLGRRKRTLPPRRVRTVVYQAIAYLEITGGEYQARCDRCTTFCNSPEGVRPRATYDNKVRDLVLERIIEDGMSIERASQSLHREFLLDLSPGFIYDALRDRAAQLDMTAHRRMVLEQFSGSLCVDELHNPVSRRIRTNNHVERTNRMIRFLEKVRYKWRRRKTLVRFVVLRLDHIWNHWAPAEVGAESSPEILRRPEAQAPTRQRPRRVA